MFRHYIIAVIDNSYLLFECHRQIIGLLVIERIIAIVHDGFLCLYELKSSSQQFDKTLFKAILTLIFFYGYDPFYDEEPDYLPMSLEQQIRVVYDSDDIMTEHLIDFYNSSRQESYDIIPASTFAVSPKTDKVFTLEDTYPERFFKWADQFIYYIR